MKTRTRKGPKHVTVKVRLTAARLVPGIDRARREVEALCEEPMRLREADWPQIDSALSRLEVSIAYLKVLIQAAAC